LKIIRSVVRTWHYLNGSAGDFPLPARIFHAVCIFSIAALLYNIPLNYWVGLPSIAWVSFISLLLCITLYYLSRFRGKTTFARLFVCLAGILLFIINFFLNSGIDGPTDVFFMMMIIIIMSVIPLKQFWIWAIANLLIVVVLHYLQYRYPGWVPFTYMNRADRFTDISSAYITVMTVAVCSFYFIRRSYEKEKATAAYNATQMKLLDEERNKLFSIIAHDLRSPLANIQSYLELLAEHEVNKEDRIVIKKELLDATHSTLEMLNNVLNWSKSQMSGMGNTIEAINISQLLTPQLMLFTSIATKKKITLHTELENPVMVLGNKGMIQLIVRNLVTNAIKFTAVEGQVSITARVVNERCLLAVKDSGNGSPAQMPANIFSLNVTSTPGTANEKGIGLGLVLCKEYTIAQNGRIWFECDEKSGTTFFVELPLANGSRPTG